MTTKPGTKAKGKVENTGDILEITGQSIAGISLLAGIAIGLAGGGLVVLGGVPLGILLMIAAYTKRTSAATMAMYMLQTKDARDVLENDVHTQ